MELNAHLVHFVAGSWMGRNDNRETVRFGQGIEQPTQLGKLFLKIDVLLAMGADDEIPRFLQFEAREHITLPDFRQIMVEYLVHWATCLDDAVRRQPLAQQVFSGDAAI